MTATHGTLLPPEPVEQGDPPKSNTAIVRPDTAGDVTGMIERLARDVDVDKLERLIAMQERVLAHNAKAAYDAAFARMQSELPEITERGKILVRGELRSTYAKLEDIQAAIKPVLKVHGFAIRHRTEWPEDRKGVIRIVGILSHEQGHSEESIFEAPLDRSDFRNEIQSMGSTVSYGRRYTTLDLLNISTRGADDDGQRAGKREDSEPPAGFADWLAGLAEISDHGTGALMKAFNKGSLAFRNFLTRQQNEEWEQLKALAAKAGK